MMTTTFSRVWRQRARATTAWLTAITVAGPIVACSTAHDALNVTAPDQIDAKKLQDPQYATLLVNSTVGDFECAYGAFTVAGGLLSGELNDVSITAARWTYDRRDVQSSESAYSQNNCDASTPGTYTPISTARYTADNAATLLQGWTDAQVPNRQDLLAKALIYSGYDRIMLGELFCTAAIDLGPELTSAQVFALAEDRFTKGLAAAQAASDAKLTALAYMGRARARLDQGNLTGADADAKLVPAGFVANVTADISNGVRINRPYAQFNGAVVSVAPQYRGLTVPTASGGTVPDTRIGDSVTGRLGADAASPLIISTKYRTGATPLPFGSYAEAQLIIAEAEGGQTAVNIINSLRQAAGLPSAFQSSDPATIQAQVIAERSRALYLQGNRAFDSRRLNLPLNPAAGAPYVHGGSYGSERCLPLPDVERNNNPTLKNG
ncbi:MAG TPA: RagB/SusD family nutrient uptake outer membrane protein [Candidatus Elarobacter sp.]|nr:RagB/SusD family nutrient uptake outer membrane protein [Candidatus Elarobacter sp.]